MLIALLAVFAKSAVDYLFERTGYFAHLPCRDHRLRSGAEYRGNDVVAALALERTTAGEQFIDHNTEAPDVGPRIEWLAAGLFWRHIGYGAENCAGVGCGHLFGLCLV